MTGEYNEDRSTLSDKDHGMTDECNEEIIGIISTTGETESYGTDHTGKTE